VGDEITVAGNTNTEPKNPYWTADAAGAEEFAIYGWWKWNSFPKSNWNNLFRVS
jgi:hypothetical protein